MGCKGWGWVAGCRVGVLGKGLGCRVRGWTAGCGDVETLSADLSGEKVNHGISGVTLLRLKEQLE